MKCGRGPKGAKAKRLGVCPAALDKRLDRSSRRHQFRQGLLGGGRYILRRHSSGVVCQKAGGLQALRFLQQSAA